jgi:spoIIIJ-associated protein
MEWVETTASSVTEAKDLALDKLGVHDSDALFEILEEPKKGFLGRTKGVARVRARIAPKAPPPKNDRSRRRGKSAPKDRTKSRNRNNDQQGGEQRNKNNKSDAQGSAQGADSGGESKSRNRNRNRSNQGKKQDAASGAQGSAAQGQSRSDKSRNDKPRAEKPKKEDTPVEQVIERVEDFLSGLVGAFGLEGAVTSNVDGDDLMANVAVTDGVLIGPKGRTLDAIQELTRVSAQRLGPTSARIKVDFGGYREARKVALVKFASQAAEKARSESVEVVLEPMSSADRKVLHDALGELDGVGSRSAGNEPRRRVVVVPEASEEAPAADEEE